ncbi:hypothetical protein MVEN_00008000 [Mycena venus]|uniref:Uncharacterized protein n=1 Tax=Mycena venus TaxID=2733690 RepID=A0A8H7DFT8_9AGAR|nr:hypothetical protein MVEN_00008000 [Mycena venus]
MRWLPFRHKAKPASSPDVLWTSLYALKDSADAFPPLKSAVSGVVALCEIAERAKHSKSDARDVALRTKEIIDVVADAIPDGSEISPLMLRSLERFRVTLDEIRSSMEAIALARGLSPFMHLRANERTIQSIKAQLDDEYHDFLAASILRVEMQQTTIAAQVVRYAQQQTEAHSDLKKVLAVNDTLPLQVSKLLFYSRFAVFLACP